MTSRWLHRGPFEEVPIEHFSHGRPVRAGRHRGGTFSAADIVARARSRLGENHYEVFKNNCEHFCEWCIRAASTSYQIDRWRLVIAWRPKSLGKGPAMHLKLSFVAALLFVLLQACTASAPKPDSVTSPGSDIPAYTTFSWRTADGSSTTTAPPLSILDQNIQNAIRSQLVAKGYREVEANPDFVVSYDVTPYQVEKKSGPPVQIGIGVGSWGGNVGGGVGTSVGVGGGQGTESTMNRLTIRAADGKTKKEVWIGSATADIKQGLDANAVGKAVAATMTGFPAHRT